MTKMQLKRYSLDTVIAWNGIITTRSITTRSIAEPLMLEGDMWQRVTEDELQRYCLAG